MEQRIITLFHESIEAKMQAGEYLAPLICEASEILVHCLLNEGKILTAGNGVSAATGFSSNEVAREPVTRRLQIKLAGEAIAVGQALGYALEEINKHPGEDWVAAAAGDQSALAAVEETRLGQTKTTAEGSRPSMGQDIQKGRRTEIEQINGFVVEKAKEVGLEAPANAYLVEAVKQVERGLAPPALDRVPALPAVRLAGAGFVQCDRVRGRFAVAALTHGAS